jgi:predicted ArsR family transcriptional regulator
LKSFQVKPHKKDCQGVYVKRLTPVFYVIFNESSKVKGRQQKESGVQKEGEMLAILGNRQQELLSLLLKNKGGLTVVELSERLKITRNAVRQHVVALESNGLVTHGESRPSGGRPEQLYVLSDTGKELFPRHYSWFAQLVVESIKQESGAEVLRERLGAMGSGVAQQLRGQYSGLENQQQKVEKLSEIMEQLGYNTRSATVGDNASVVEADNCIFHDLAIKDPEICQFDLALLSTFTDSEIDHEECMAKGGNVCRFKFTPKT